MNYDLQVEAVTLTAIAEAMEKGDNEPENYVIALHGMASRLRSMANRVDKGGE